MTKKRPMSHTALVEGIRKRDHDAITEFWERFRGRVHFWCLGVIGNDAVAEDCAVNTLVRFIYSDVDKLKNPRCLKSFLYVMSKRQAIAEITGLKRFDNLDETMHENQQLSPDEVSNLLRIQKIIMACHKKLRPEFREVLVLKLIHELSDEKAGELLNISDRMVRDRFSNARERLGRCIQSKTFSYYKTKFLSLRVDRSRINMAIESFYRFRKNNIVEHCDSLELLAAAYQHPGNAMARDNASRHLSTCENCRRTVLACEVPDEEDRKPRAKKSEIVYIESHPTWRFVAIAAAILLLILSSFLVVSKLSSVSTVESMATKSGSDRIYVAARRRDSEFLVRSMDRLEKGDQIGLFYSTEKSGYLMVLNLDEAGTVNRLYPVRGSKSARVEAGTKVPLPDGGLVETGAGCEWFIAVFSDVPLSQSEMNASLSAARMAPVVLDCHLDITIPQARTVEILPVRR